MTETNTFTILNASAGSGKTYSLVKQYITTLLKSGNPNKFRHLLAITFTNKAVEEMKDRILETLHAISLYRAEDTKPAMLDDLMISSKLTLEEVVIKSEKILDRILHNYSAFDVVTIDTLTHRIIRTFAKDLNISGSFEVSLDQNTLNMQAVDALVSKVGIDQEVTQVLVDFAIEKADDDKSWDITRDLNDIARLLHNENDIKSLELLKNKSLSDFKELAKYLKSEMKTLAQSQQKIATELLELIHALGLDQKSFASGHYYKFIVEVSEAKKKSKYTGSAYKDQIESYTFYTKTQKEDIKGIIDSNRVTFVNTFLKLKELSGKQKMFEAFKSKLIPLSVLQLIKNELENIKEEQNVLLISDFNKLISTSLRDQPAAFLYERLGERYTNYFIDEFQDTSIMQWDNLIPLIDNSISTLSNDQVKNSLLLVGDPKQAIYRWRGGEAEQFINLSIDKNPFSIPIAVDQLETNYRSHAEVITFNNSFFTHISSHFENIQYADIYSNENAQKLNHRSGGYVSIDFVDYQNKEEADLLYPERVLEIINDVTQDGFSPSDICILTRSNSHGSIIAQSLEEAGISVISSESLLIANSKTVKFIHGFLTMLFYPDQEENKLPVLYFLSDYLNIKEPHLFYSKSIKEPVTQLLIDLNTYNIFVNLDHIQTLTLYECLEYIIQRFTLQDKSDAYVFAYLDLAYNYTQKHSGGALGFIDYWEEKKEKVSIVAPEQKDAVQIMSIHKSKGLEFPVVIYPYADTDIYRTRGEHQWYPTTNEGPIKGFPALMVSHSSALSEFGDVGTQLFEQKHNEQQFDSLNVLYVALTRAVERLYVISRFRESIKKISTLTDLFIDYLQSNNVWNVEQRSYTFGKAKNTEKEDLKLPNLTYQLPFISTSKEDLGIQIATQASFLWDENKQDAITFGNLIHDLMATIKTKEDVASVIEIALLDGIITQSETEIIQELITNILDHPSLQHCFSLENEIMTERIILSSKGKYHIPDRVETTPDGKTIVIDYKTGEQSPSHKGQISTYGDLLTEMGYVITQKLLIYTNDKVDVIAV